MLEIQTSSIDHEAIFDLLLEAAKDGEFPPFTVDGNKGYYDPTKLALLLPDSDLNQHHQTAVDAMFKKRQRGYRSAGLNLASRAGNIAHNRRLRAAIQRGALSVSNT